MNTPQESWPFPITSPIEGGITGKTYDLLIFDELLVEDTNQSDHTFGSLLKDIAKQNKQMEKEYRTKLLEAAKANGIGIVHVHPSWNNKGGITIAFKKSSKFKSGSMVDVAVATCSSQDTFSRKIGTTLALEKFNDGETVQLPLLQSWPDEDLSYVVKLAFSALYDIV